MDDRRDSERVEQVERGRMAAEELSWALRSLNRAAAEVDHALAARVGLRPMDYAAMGHVMSQEGAPLGPAELGHRLGISTGSATELVDRLERAGHIARSRDAADRRRVSLVPQKQAVERILAELGPLFGSLDDLSGEFTPDEQRVIDRYLRQAATRMTDHARQLARPGPRVAPEPQRS